MVVRGLQVHHPETETKELVRGTEDLPCLDAPTTLYHHQAAPCPSLRECKVEGKKSRKGGEARGYKGRPRFSV